MSQDILHTITSDTVVLTPNQQLASFIVIQCDTMQPRNSNWSNSNILTINNWLQNTWQQQALTTQDILLSDAQRHTIWEEIIRNSSQGTLLLNTTATTRTAIEAWTLLNAWQINLDHPLFNYSEDTRVWQHWAKEFVTRCHDHHWLDTSRLINSLISIIKSDKLHLPQQFILIGFNEITPQQNELLKILANQNCKIIHHKLSMPATQSYRLSLTDSQSELRTMARWAKNCLATDAASKIACVIPKLNELKNQALQIFTEIFSSENLLPSGKANYLPFTINAGQPLNNYPIIYTALQIIALARPQIPITELSSLIRSPFIGGADQEMSARAVCDAKIRELNTHEITLDKVINIANKIPGCDLLVQQLQNFLELCSKKYHKQNITEWANQFTEQLNALNWPNNDSLDNNELQLIEQWQTLLQEFTSLDHLMGPLNFYSSQRKLNSLASLYIFQPQLPNRPIQIHGVLEASGMLFDQLWIMGLDDSVWPSKAQANSFIPIQLQRELNMPHCSAEQEWRFAQNLTTQFLHAASTVILSYAQQENDRQLRASSLIKDISDIKITDLSLADDFSLIHQIYQSGESEEFIDYQAPAISANENIKGGTALLKHQAACPFRAFAIYRLGATPLAEVISGMPPIERGKLVHSILEQFWQTTKSHHQLMLLSEDNLTSIISNIVSSALKKVQSKFPHLLGQRRFKIEQHRLTNLMQRWMQWEKSRTPFTVIATEQQFSFTLGQLDIKMQLDRMDQIADNHYMIIDYKTSKISIQDWFGDRPNEPQLPLYCIASIVPINTVTFAQIRADEVLCRATGDIALTDQDNSTKLLTAEQWLAQKIQWQNALTQLSEEFSNGIAHVNPKYGAQTCELCHLKILCRIHEARN